MAFSPDGKTLALASWDGGLTRPIKLWDVASGQLKATLKGNTLWIKSMAFSPDGKTLATGSNDGTIKLWDVTAVGERKKGSG